MEAGSRQPTPYGKYALLERVSVGGMAEVFKAKAFGVEGFEKILAIKRILPSMAEDADFIEMFIDEAKICGQLNHANICQIYELGRVGDSHFIAMEFVWGKDTLQIQNRFRKLRQKMKPEMAAFIASKICEGLDYAHKKKDAQGKSLSIIHRDISPQNILISYEGELKVIDFGIAKAASRSSKTQAGVLKGKFGYMSPEQVRGLPLDRRSDLFAIGTILYELLTAERLFHGESDFETLEKVRNVEVTPPSVVNTNVPRSLEKIVMRALCKDVEGRYQWASEMAEDLNAFLLERDPAFNSQNLSQWMREQFAVEMRRERLVLDEQEKVTRELLATSSEPMQVTQSARPAQKSAGKLAKPIPTPAEDEDDDFNEKTTVSGPAFDTADPRSLPAQSTRILDGGDRSPPPPRDLPAQETVVFLDQQQGSGQSRAPLEGRPFGGVSVGEPSQVYGEPSFTPHYGQLVPPRAPRSTLLKDILMGVGVAAALVAAILGARALLNKRGEATLVVVSPIGGGELVVDGAPRGTLAASTPVTLKAVPTGEHVVLVRGEGGEFRQVVALTAGDVSVVTAVFATPGAQTGKLKLDIEAPTASGSFERATADVYVDGAELSAEASSGTISLRSGVPHEIRVVKTGLSEKKFSVDIKTGETVVRAVRLEVGGAHLVLTSDPPGAEVYLNGKRAGVTPLRAGDLDATKQARVSLRLAGFQQVTKIVSFDTGAEQTLDVHLIADVPDVVARNDKPARPPTASPKLSKKEAKEVAKKADEPAKEAKEEPPKEIVKAADTAPSFPTDGLAKVSFGSDGAKDKPATQETGFLVANTQPWAKVWLDGKDTGKTTPIAPRSKIALKPGKHTVTFVVSGKKYNYDITVKPGEEVRLIKQLSDTQ